MKFKFDTSTTEGKIAVMEHYRRAEYGNFPVYLCRRDPYQIWNKSSNHPAWNWDEFDYNYPEEPRKVLKPWTFETMPKDANLWVRDHARGMARVSYIGLTAFTAKAVSVTFEDAMKRCEHSLDNGATWLPCGIETEE